MLPSSARSSTAILQIKLNGDEYFSSGAQSDELDTLPPRLADRLSAEAQTILKNASSVPTDKFCVF